jgi:hypothetical protein
MADTQAETQTPIAFEVHAEIEIDAPSDVVWRSLIEEDPGGPTASKTARGSASSRGSAAASWRSGTVAVPCTPSSRI